MGEELGGHVTGMWGGAGRVLTGRKGYLSRSRRKKAHELS